MAQSIYGGKEHQSIINNSVDNSQKTGFNTSADASIKLTNYQLQIDNLSNAVSQDTTISADVFGGSSILHVSSGEANAGNAEANGTKNYSSAFANAQAAIQNTTVYTNRNTTQLTENGAVLGNIYGGNSILDVYSAKAKAGNAIATGYNSQTTAHAYSYTSIVNSSVQANENAVSATDNASIAGNIFAGKATLFAQSQEAYAGDVDGGLTSNFANSHAVVADSAIHSDRNTITIADNASITGNVHGGYSEILVNSSVAKAGNANFINSSNTSTNVHASARNSLISANHNIVTIAENTNVQGHIFGGYAKLIAVAGQGTSGSANGNSGNAYAFVHARDTKLYANDNQITLASSLGHGSIYGGYVIFELHPGKANQSDGKAGDTHIDQSGSVTEAINNNITIDNRGRILNSATSLYGGYLEVHHPKRMPVSYSVFSGNTLNFSAKPTSINQLANFEYYNFTIQPELANMQAPLITARDIVLGTHSLNHNGANNTSKIQVVGIHSGNILEAGDRFYLMQADNSMSGFGGEGLITQVQQGISLIYDVKTEVDMAQGTVIAQIVGRKNNSGSDSRIKINPQLDALPSGLLSGALLIARGSDVIAEDVMDTLTNEYNGFNFFVHGSGNHSQYSLGYIKSDDRLLTAGISYKQNSLASAFFVETGSGNYDSSINPAFIGKVNSDGHNRYYGVGILGRYQFDNGLYTHGSVRVGSSKNTFASKDIINFATGQYASYSLKSCYVSTHIGVGKVFSLTQDNEFDVSAKYLWTRLEGKDAIVMDDPIRFKSIDSKRFRANANLSHLYNKSLTFNTGLGYEYEFDVKAEGSTYGIFDTNAPDIRGGIGIVSFGAKYQSEAHPDFSIDIKTHSYIGKRKGESLGVTLNYQF